MEHALKFSDNECMILLVDNYDSFVHNLARYLERLGAETRVIRNDEVGTAGVRALRPTAIVLSPGPCTPDEAGNSIDMVRTLHAEFPILGVCLGHQTIASAFGGRVVRAAEPMHGRASLIEHDGTRLFEGMPSPMRVGRYHSLIADEATLPAELKVTARTPDGVIMAFEHVSYPIFGVQFHPESILTEHGFRLLGNFLQLAGLQTFAPPNGMFVDELRPTIRPRSTLPTRPVTF